jgi:predicted ABC-type ATPase
MDIQKISNDIATLKRAVKTAATASLKDKLKKKISSLDQVLKDSNIPAKKLAMALLGAKRKVASYSTAEFNEVIKRLSYKAEYSFLKGLTKPEIKDDLERYAKNPGWRFKGRSNFKTPTKKDLINDMGKPTSKRKTYYEARSNRSDVTKPVKLATGGGVLDPKAQKFLDTIRVADRSIELKDITVDATPSGNWRVYHKGKSLMRVNGDLLNDETITKYGLEYYQEMASGGGANKMAKGGYLEGREEYEGYKYLIWYRVPKGYSVSGDEGYTKKMFDNESVYFDTYGEAKEHAELSIRIATEQYAKGGSIGSTVHIMDEKSLMNKKSGVIIGEDGTFWLVKTLSGVGLVKKSRVKVIEDFATGGGVSNLLQKEKEKLQEQLNDAIQKERYSTMSSIEESLNRVDYLIEYEQKSGKKISAKEIKNLLNPYTKWDDKYNIEDFATGGGVGNENKEMVLNNTQQIEHHAEELENAAKKSKHVPAWVVAKIYNASSNISDATHYLEGVNTMPKEQYERIHEEIESYKMETGGGLDSFLNKQMHISKVCKNNGCSTKDYLDAKKKYSQLGNINDLFKKKSKGGGLEETCEIFDSKGERAIDDKSIEKLTRCVTSLPQTKSSNINTNGNYTREREGLHKKIIDKFKKDVVCIEKGRPIAVLMGGSPASGKSTFLKKYRPYLLSDSLFKVDADEIRAELPEYKGWNASQTHEETGDIVDALISDRNVGIPCKFDFVFDGTMSSVKRYKILINNLRKEGYDIFIVFMGNIPKEEIKERALKRYQKSGRFVPMFVIEDFYANGEKNLNELKSLVDGYIFVDGSTYDYKIMEQGGKKLPNKRLYEKLGEKIKLASGGAVGGTYDSSSTGEVLGGTYGSSKSGEMIGGTMASSMAKGGVSKKDFIAKKVGKVMREFKEGDLHIGTSNKIVKNPKQAIAIGLSEGNKGWKYRKK